MVKKYKLTNYIITCGLVLILKPNNMRNYYYFLEMLDMWLKIYYNNGNCYLNLIVNIKSFLINNVFMYYINDKIISTQVS